MPRESSVSAAGAAAVETSAAARDSIAERRIFMGCVGRRTCADLPGPAIVVRFLLLGNPAPRLPGLDVYGDNLVGRDGRNDNLEQAAGLREFRGPSGDEQANAPGANPIGQPQANPLLPDRKDLPDGSLHH